MTAEDLAGNSARSLLPLQLLLDTAGPQITDIRITGSPTFDLFGLKPGSASPTPLTNSLTISVRDLPNQLAGFIRDAIQSSTPGQPFTLPNAGIFQVKGDHNGIVAIQSITVTPGPVVFGSPATASIVVNFVKPLPDDRFTLTIKSAGLIDPAGNQLDGESNASEPNGLPSFLVAPFATGDGIPGGDFSARFTIDTRPELANFAAASIFVDLNGNFLDDTQGINNDAVNRDVIFNLGVANANGTIADGGFTLVDGAFVGNFSNTGVADGFDKLAAYGFFNGNFRWLIDTNNDGRITIGTDFITTQLPVAGFNVNGLPIAANVVNPGSKTSPDEIGLFDGNRFYFDTNQNHVIDGGDFSLSTQLRGRPITGDFDGDGFRRSGHLAGRSLLLRLDQGQRGRNSIARRHRRRHDQFRFHRQRRNPRGRRHGR